MVLLSATEHHTTSDPASSDNVQIPLDRLRAFIKKKISHVKNLDGGDEKTHFENFVLELSTFLNRNGIREIMNRKDGSELFGGALNQGSGGITPTRTSPRGCKLGPSLWPRAVSKLRC